MGDRVQEFHSTGEGGITASSDWQSHLQEFTLSDWQRIARCHAPQADHGARTWVEELDNEFIVHNPKAPVQDAGIKGSMLATSEWLAPIGLPAVTLGAATLLKMTTPGKLVMLGVGAIAGMGWSMYRMDQESALRMQALPVHVPKASIPTGDAHTNPLGSRTGVGNGVVRLADALFELERSACKTGPG